MAEFQDVMKQARRMCKDHKECETCPASKLMEPFDECPLCGGIDAAEVENVVMQWVVENPEPVYPTWSEWQEATFPDGVRKICLLNVTGREACSEWSDCAECRAEPIPADIAEKLGVKPIGGTTDENAR